MFIWPQALCHAKKNLNKNAHRALMLYMGIFIDVVILHVT